MPSRHALAALATVAAVLGLAACTPTTTTRTAMPSAPPPAVQPTDDQPPAAPAPDQPTPAASPDDTADPQSGLPADQEPHSVPCQGPTAFPAGTKMVDLTRPATSTTLYAKDATPSCSDVDGEWIWNPTGSEKAYRISTDAAFALTMSSAIPKPVTLGQFLAHTQKCQTGGDDTTTPCSHWATYQMTLNSSGEVVKLSEMFYS